MTDEDEQQADARAERNREIEQKNAELLRAYQLTFNSPSGQRVLQDLMAFGKFRLPIDDRADEGKRQVVLRIMDFSQLNTEQVSALYRGRMVVKES